MRLAVKPRGIARQTLFKRSSIAFSRVIGNYYPAYLNLYVFSTTPFNKELP